MLWSVPTQLTHKPRSAALALRSAAKPGKSVSSSVAQRIANMTRATPGRAFTSFDFLDLGSPHSVGMVLTRMMRSGDLRRLARGLYDVPRTHSVLGELLPTADDFAQALARRDARTRGPSAPDAVDSRPQTSAEGLAAGPGLDASAPTLHRRAGMSSLLGQLRQAEAELNAR